MTALARTFDDDKMITVEILSGPSSTGLCKVTDGSKIFARHRDRLTAINDEARKILNKTP